LATDVTALRVVIAERDLTYAETLRALVSQLGLNVVNAVARTTAETLDLCSRLRPDVALVDVRLCAGTSLVPRITRVSADTRVIVLSSEQDRGSQGILEALTTGAAGAVFKHAAQEELHRALLDATSMSPAIPTETSQILLKHYIVALEDKRRRDLATMRALAAAVEAKDTLTGQHLMRVAGIARSTLDAIDPALSTNEEVEFGFMLHDVGKIGIPDSILHKPGPLSVQEWNVMRTHPDLGVNLVEPLGFSERTIEVIRSHHERWDGRGYPLCLERDEVPLSARVFAIADTYDAIVSDRPYRSKMSRAHALEVIAGEAGKQFDPEVTQIFLDVQDKAEDRLAV
jgi:ribonuclease P protein subunit RPR2